MLIALCRLFKPPVGGVEEVDPPSTFGTVLADAFALPTPSLPNDTPSDLAALPQGTKPTAAEPTPFLPNTTLCDPAPLPESTNHANDATDNTCPSVWICRKWYTVPPGYPPGADDQTYNDQQFCSKLQEDFKKISLGCA